MKKLLFGMFTIGVLFTSCGKDEPDCAAEDFVGTYLGTVNCPGEDVTSATIIITKISDTQVSVVDNDGFVILSDISECQIKGSMTEDGEIFTATFNLDGNSLSYVGTVIDGGESSTCTGTFSK